MRSRFRSALVALAAVLAVCAVASASALASQPDMETGGNWPISYSATSGEVTLQSVGVIVKCSASKNRGEVASKFSFANINITYTGCKTSEAVCTSTGAAAGEIRTNTLISSLVYINEATGEVGQLFKPQTKGGTIAEYACGSTTVKTSGGVIAKLPNEQVNKLRTSFTWDYRQKSSIQEPSEYEEGATKVSAYLQSVVGPLGLKLRTGEEATETMTFSSGVEIHT